jgi:hypothetical protein
MEIQGTRYPSRVLPWEIDAAAGIATRSRNGERLVSQKSLCYDASHERGCRWVRVAAGFKLSHKADDHQAGPMIPAALIILSLDLRPPKIWSWV